MDKKQEAMKILTAKDLIDPLLYILGFYQDKTGLSEEEYYRIRYELAVRNKNDKQAEEALEYYHIFYRE